MNTPPSAATNQYPRLSAVAAIPTIGWFKRISPVDPWKRASPNEVRVLCIPGAGQVRLDQGEAFLDDEQNRVLGLVTSYRHAEWGELEQVGALWSLGNLEVSLDRAPPALGEHTREVLSAVGLDETTIAELLAESVAVQSSPEEPAI